MSTAPFPRGLLRTATLVGLGVAVASIAVLVPLMLHASDEPGATTPAVAAASSAPARGPSAKARTRSRCEHCGVVESITHFEPNGAQAASYEFTVRLRDGSARVSSLPSPFSWRVGDQIMLMGGEAPVALK